MKRRLGSVLLAAALMSGMLPAYAVELTVEDTGTVIQSEADWADVSALVAAYEDDSFYGEITIDPQTNEVQKDQETISLQQEFEMTKQEEREILGSADAAEQYFEQQDTFETYTDDSGVVHVTEPYQTARLIVFADELDSDYGAEEVLYLEQYDEYILQFTQSADARNACEQLQSALGEENCFPDEMQTEDMLLAEDGLDTQSQESVSWGTEYMGLDQLQQQVDIYGLSDRHATVAVVDTGIDSDNSMFAGRFVTGYNFVSSSQQELDDMVDPKDCVSLDTSDYYDYDVRNGGGHGTHVAGIVADATSDNVEIMALRVFDAMGKSYYSLIISALQYADEHDADVVNLSLGIENIGQTVFDRTIQQLYDDGIVVVAAAGNKTRRSDGTYILETMYPATLSDTIAVSALNQDGSFASLYSCYGEEIDFAAPGTSIVSARKDGTYSVKSGTSMAAPHISAAVAMICLLHPDYTPAEYKEILMDYAVDLGDAGKDEQYGYGAVQLAEYYEDEVDGYRLDVKGAVELQLKYTKMNYTGSKRQNPVTLVRTETGEVIDASCYKTNYSNCTGVGTATVTVTGVGQYKGTLTATYSVVPKNVSLSKPTNLASRKLKVQWSMGSNCHGYQIQYATRSDFSNAKSVTVSGRKTVSKTLTGLTKGKTYYVRVRPYKVVDGTSYRGRWSAVQSRKISK